MYKYYSYCFVVVVIISVLGLLEPSSSIGLESVFLRLPLGLHGFLLVWVNDISDVCNESGLALQSYVDDQLAVILTILFLEQVVHPELHATTLVAEQFFLRTPVYLVQ